VFVVEVGGERSGFASDIVRGGWTDRKRRGSGDQMKRGRCCLRASKFRSRVQMIKDDIMLGCCILAISEVCCPVLLQDTWTGNGSQGIGQNNLDD
jgi:hypothetical protein